MKNADLLASTADLKKTLLIYYDCTPPLKITALLYEQKTKTIYLVHKPNVSLNLITLHSKLKMYPLDCSLKFEDQKNVFGFKITSEKLLLK